MFDHFALVLIMHMSELMILELAFFHPSKDDLTESTVASLLFLSENSFKVETYLVVVLAITGH